MAFKNKERPSDRFLTLETLEQIKVGTESKWNRPVQKEYSWSVVIGGGKERVVGKSVVKDLL